MAILYKTPKDAFFTEGESLTEQEHQDSCDINKMIKSALRGMEVRGSDNDRYGYDDMTMDGLSHRIQKQALEESLTDLANKNEYTDEELAAIPESVKQKFKFKSKGKSQKAKNDDQTTNKAQPDVPIAENESKPTDSKANPPPSNDP